MGQSAGAVDVYAVMVSPLVVNANPSLVHRVVPISGGLSLGGELPAGSIATLAPASAYAGQAAFLLAQLVIGDGLATDVTVGQRVHRDADQRPARRLPARQERRRDAARRC